MITRVLRNRFIFPVTKLSSAIKHFAGLENVAKLFNLVRTYLPDEYDALIVLPPYKAATRFVDLFSKNYFPIRSIDGEYLGEDYVLTRLTERIPVEFHGISRYEYDSAYQMPSAQLLAGSICVCPFEDGGEWCHAGLTHMNGARVALVDRFIRSAEEAAKLLPEQGWELQKVLAVLEDSPYIGLADWCKWIFAQTGNVWLDTERETVQWERERVELLAREWPLYQDINQRMKAFNKWLNKDFAGRSVEVVKYIAAGIPHLLIEVFGGEHDSEAQSRPALSV